MMLTTENQKVFFPSKRQAPYFQNSDLNDADGGRSSDSAAASERNNNNLATSQHSNEADAAGGGVPLVRRFSSSHRISSIHQFLGGTAETSRRSRGLTPATPRSSSVNKERESLLQRYRREIAWGTRPAPTHNIVVTPDWRILREKERMKTLHIGLLLCLHIGTEPPDIVKPFPCAVLQCWMDPNQGSRAKAKELIGKRLETQYTNARTTTAARPLRFKRAMDPTAVQVEEMCLQLRRQAKNDRVLLHYNGHGVPRPTDIGEMWVLDNNREAYFAISVLELRSWLGKPSIIVLDCSGAGVLLPFFAYPLEEGTVNMQQQRGLSSERSGSRSSLSSDDPSSRWVRDTIVLAPCGANETLPLDPAYPADIFTSCLTTPIPMALRWFVQRNPHSTPGLDPDVLEKIPGKTTDRKTPLGELNWIFTAVTDSIAWDVLPKYMFQRLFRQDLLIAAMFRNFLLADRILRHLGCSPISHPQLPATADHPLWLSWDLACETMLFQLMKNGVFPVKSPSSTNEASVTNQEDSEFGIPSPSTSPLPTTPISTNGLPSGATIPYVSSPFFSEQLTAFGVWLDLNEMHKVHLATGALPHSSPEQLPVVLQVLLMQVHRDRALNLLQRFMDLGPWAVNQSLSLGIFPYILKLLQSPQYLNRLVSIWASVLAFDPACRVDLLRDGAFHHFVQHLMWGLDSSVTNAAASARERTLTAFVLANACHGYPAGQVACAQLNLHGSCGVLLSSYEQGENAQDNKSVEMHLPPSFRLWLVLCLASMVIDNAPIQNEAFSAGVHLRLLQRLRNDENATVRAAACFALGSLVGSQPKRGSRSSSRQDISGIAPQQIAPGPGLFPQAIASSAPMGNVLLPETMQQAQIRGQFRAPTASGIANLPLAGAQTIQAVPVGQAAAGSQVPPAFWSQPVSVQPATQVPMAQPPYTSQPLVPGTHQLGAPPSFLVGNTAHMQPIVSGPTPFRLPAAEPSAPSIFDDRHRLDLDMLCIDMLIQGINDASVVVRYEAVVGLACAVGKYLEAFVNIAGEAVAAERPAASVTSLGINSETMNGFKSAWQVIRKVQKDDVFPEVSKAANRIVLFVNEHLLRLTTDQESEIGREGRSLRGGRPGRPLQGISEENQDGSTNLPTDLGRFLTISSKKSDIRRVASEVTNPNTGDSMERNAHQTTNNNEARVGEGLSENPISYKLPKSSFYTWQKDSFDLRSKPGDTEFKIDPLSPEGGRLLYQQRRNSSAKRYAQQISKHFTCMAPKAPKAEEKGLNFILEEEDQEAVAAAELELTSKKKQLELKETWLLKNDGEENLTSIVRFHPYEDYLVSCDIGNSISTWDINTGKRLTRFPNGNPAGTKLTTSCWINETSQSHFLVGSNAGTVTLWGGLAEARGQESSPTLVTAFNALPMNLETERNFHVCEWQPSKGTLISAGSSKYINCWDMESERLAQQIETNSTANITSLATAWDNDPESRASIPPASAGLGPNIIVAGQSDGTLRLYDLRAQNSIHDTGIMSSRQFRRHGPRATQYVEHKSWVVTTAFTNYANKYEIISGSISGEVKAWDLRQSSSIRTVETQRSPMTALAVHPRIPMMASGSEAQFIKLLTLDGDFLQILRYHEKGISQRIGEVSCVAFHPHKAILAAGAKDSYIGIYAPKKEIV